MGLGGLVKGGVRQGGVFIGIWLGCTHEDIWMLLGASEKCQGLVIPEDCGYFVCTGAWVALKKKKREENNKQGLTSVSSTQRKEGEQEVVPASSRFSCHSALTSGDPTMERNKGLMP